jgi:pimeloyl-ACP methyl ester carboxylesterase
VFALTYGERTGTVFSLFQIGGLTPMEQSSAELARFVDTVLGATGAAKVDIVGHSQGSLMPDYYAKYLGGGSKIGKYVGIAPLWDGSTASGLAELYALGAPSGLSGLLLDSWCQSCHEFLAGSDFIKKMNANGGPRVPGIAYTMLMTDHDEAVTPYTSGYMAGATNIVLQNVCPDDFSEHVAMAFDTNVDQLLLNALDPAHAKAVHCGNVFTTYF